MNGVSREGIDAIREFYTQAYSTMPTFRITEPKTTGFTPEFVAAMSQLLALQEGGLAVEAPAIALSSVELAQIAQIPLSTLAWAHSCHKADVSCGACRGCNKYFETFRALEHELG